MTDLEFFLSNHPRLISLTLTTKETVLAKFSICHPMGNISSFNTFTFTEIRFVSILCKSSIRKYPIDSFALVQYILVRRETVVLHLISMRPIFLMQLQRGEQTNMECTSRFHVADQYHHREESSAINYSTRSALASSSDSFGLRYQC
jgi:hypothetical protein